MTPKRHKKRLLKLITDLKAEVRLLLEEEHLPYPYKNQEQVELDIDHFTQEIERTELAK